MRLVVVESPKKVQTIQHYLGDGYIVAATIGHIRDLPTDELGIDLKTFAPTYVLYEAKAAAVARIKKLAKTADEVLLATDVDREGEAIAWHLSEVLNHPRISRIRLEEITQSALKRALAEPGAIDQHRVDAQATRRILDRLVGYQVSPLLRAFGPNQSAGRVQSAALHLVVQRELARERFRPEKWFTATVWYDNGLPAKYAALDDTGELVETRFATRAEAEAITARARAPHTVSAVDTKPVEARPKPPFTTSLLQQAASVVLDLKPAVTMALAQQLFEGGLITYHRTDSVTLSSEAIQMARDAISREHPEALPPEAPTYKNKSTAQAAHEAIRPTALGSPEIATLSGQLKALYALIEARFLASQCKPACYDQITVTFTCGDTTWRSRGRVITAHNWLHYVTRDEDDEARSEPTEPIIPHISTGDVHTVLKFDVKELTSKPPPRFTQASLVRELEHRAIGRPSTYASIVDDETGILFTRGYLAAEKKAVLPTPKGRLIDEMLAKAFPDIVSAENTAQLEERLDEIEAGNRRRLDELKAWYPGFERQLSAAAGIYKQEIAARPELAAEAPKPTGKPCPLCAKELFLRPGKNGAFLACSGYPTCSYTTDANAKTTTTPCPKCAKPLEEIEGRYGRYARCPDRSCGHKVDLAAPVDEKCPVCDGPMRDKGTFYGCTRFPDCTGSLDKAGLEAGRKAGKTCPDCGRPVLLKKNAKGSFWGCSRWPLCKHLEPIGESNSSPRKGSQGSRRGAR